MMFDHADVYGGDHLCERRFGEAMAFSPAERDAVIIQSKVGIRDGYFDFSTEHILASVDESLAALRTDHLDVLLLHRPDALVEPDEVAAAFDALEAAGKVQAFGVSNHTPYQVELLKRSVRQPLAFNQVQLSITHAPLIAAGVASNMVDLDQSIDRDNGILDYARINDITLQAWSPYQAGFFTGVFIGDRENYAELNDVLDELAGAVRRDADRHRDGVDHAAPRRHAGHPRHDEARAGAGGGGRLRPAPHAAGVVPPLHRGGPHRPLTPRQAGPAPAGGSPAGVPRSGLPRAARGPGAQPRAAR